MTTTNLNKLAAICRAESIVTKAAQRALLRQHGHKQAALADLRELIREQHAARLARNMLLYKCGALPRRYIVINDSSHDAHVRIGRPKLYRLPLGTPGERRDKRIRHELGQYVRSFTRLAAHGELDIVVGDSPSVAQTERLDHDIYRGAHRGRPCRVQDTTITVPANWYKSVFAAGLAGLDGLVTLSAEQISRNVYKAAWLENGRGTSLKIVHGWIAAARASNGTTLAHHSEDSEERAKSGLTKKYIRWIRQNSSASTDSAVFKAALKNHKTIVTVRHAQRFGLCLPGIRSWLANTDLDPDGKAPLSAVADWALRVPNYDAARFVTAMQIKSAK